MRSTTPRSSRQGAPLAIDDLRPSYRIRSRADRHSELSRSDFVRWPEVSVSRVAAIRPKSGVKPTCRDSWTDAFDRAPRGRELSVREDLTRIIVDWSGSWQ